MVFSINVYNQTYNLSRDILDIYWQRLDDEHGAAIMDNDMVETRYEVAPCNGKASF